MNIVYNKSEDEILRLLILKLLCIGHLSCQYIKKDDSILSRSKIFRREDHLSCQYIKKDSSICEKGCWHASGCARHYKAYPRTIYLICNKQTYSNTGIYSSYGGESKKTKIESDVVKILS